MWLERTHTISDQGKVIRGLVVQYSNPIATARIFGPLEEGRPASSASASSGQAWGSSSSSVGSFGWPRYLPPYKPDKAFHAAFPGFEAALASRHGRSARCVEIRVPDDEIRNRIRLSDRNNAIFQTVESFARRLLRHRREEGVLNPSFQCV